MIDIAGLSQSEIVDLFEQAYSSVEEVCSQLEPGDWDLPTDLPGWSVKDVLSHLTHYEAVATGTSDDPPLDTSSVDYVKNDFGAINERGVQARRARSGPEILSEFRDVTAQRLKDLREPGSFDKPSVYPVTTTPLKDLWQIRLLDFCYHEQDIRGATNRPGHLDGAVAGACLAQLATRALPRIVAKLAQAPDGSVVVFDVAPPGETFAIGTENGRGSIVEPTEDPTDFFRTGLEAFFRLVGGRKSATQLRAVGLLEVQGDHQLAERILQNIVVTP